MLTVYQTDESGLLQGGARQEGSKSHRQVLVAPPAVPAGHAARWVTTLHPVADTKAWGDPGTGSWEVIEDHRHEALWLTSGEPYTLGAEHEGEAYDGLGSVPVWLTDIAPEPVPLPPVYPQFTALEMLDLFTESEQLAVVQATMADAAVKLWYDRLIAATFVTYEDPRTDGGLQALVDAELLTAQRKAEIVAAMQPAVA